MEARRSGMALRPLLATGGPSPNGGGVRTNSLKRTISKCGLDVSGSANDLSGLAAKKLAPLVDPATVSPGLRLSQQQLHQIQGEAALMRQQLQFYTQQQQPPSTTAVNDVYEDDGEPVLLPRHLPPFAPPYDGVDDERHPCAHEYSPVAPFRWDGTPQGAKNRYYESLLESSSAAFASPSPQHVLYAYTPDSSARSTNSTLSFASSSAASAYGEYDAALVAQTVAITQQQALQDREYLSAANLHAIMVMYLEEMFQYYDLAKSFTFARVSEMVQSVPFAFKYIQGLVKNRLGISWHLVGSFVENVLEFICDDDIRDASVKEFADFLRSIQEKLYENMPPGNIFLNLYEFFQNVLAKFKKYLIHHWLQLQRIQFPCEFGKKSETLFLCLECHREHF